MRAKPNHCSRVFATATWIWLLESTQWQETLPQISHLAVEHSDRSALWHISMQMNKPRDVPSLKHDPPFHRQVPLPSGDGGSPPAETARSRRRKLCGSCREDPRSVGGPQRSSSLGCRVTQLNLTWHILSVFHFPCKDFQLSATDPIHVIRYGVQAMILAGIGYVT